MHHGEVRLVVRIFEIGVEGEELVRRQHALVDDHLRGQADEEQQLVLGELGVVAQPVRRGLADQVETALKGIALDAARADEQLLHGGHGCSRRVADVRLVRPMGHGPPTEQILAGGGDLLCDHGFAVRPLGRVTGQEDDARAVSPGSGQVDAQVGLGDLGQEPVRQRGEDPGTVAGVLLVAETAAVDHAAVHVSRGVDDLAARPALDVADEPDAARVLLQRGVVQPLALGQSVGELFLEARQWPVRRVRSVRPTRPCGAARGPVRSSASPQKWQKCHGLSSGYALHPAVHRPGGTCSGTLTVVERRGTSTRRAC